MPRHPYRGARHLFLRFGRQIGNILAHTADTRGMARRIRIWKERGLYHGTLQCIDRMFLLNPSNTLNNTIGACLGRAQRKFPIRLHSLTTNINQLEFIFSIGMGQLQYVSLFLQFFAGLVARELNRVYKREGHFWAGRARVEEFISDSQGEKFLGYGAFNVVKDGLVEKAYHWKGFSTNEALARGKKFFLSYLDRTLWWKNRLKVKQVYPSKYTVQVEVKVYPLPSWRRYPVHRRQAMFRRIIRDWEQAAREERTAEGKGGVKGMARISKESPFDKPQNPREKTPQPLCHADTVEDYKQYEEAYSKIMAAYRLASADYRNGAFEVEFPPGTFRPRLSDAYKQAA